MQEERFKQIVARFAISGTVSAIRPLGEGLINDTYLVTTAEATAPDYVLQRINTNVFPDVDLLMGNIIAVTRHLRHKLATEGAEDLSRRVLQFIPLRTDADTYYMYAQDDAWRMMVYIDHTVTKQEVTPANSRAAGEAFGRFQAMLADLNEPLGETIKDFHNMEYRLQQLRQAVEADTADRCNEPAVVELLQKIAAREHEMTAAERLYREGKLPKRVCHCDTKVNNMLFSEDGQEVLCVIDLDTVMPSFVFSDYGDFLRTAANSVAEDCADLDAVAFRRDIYEAFTEGYLSEARAFLTPLEIEMLPFAVKLFPFMQSVRFLWDYLSGDHYWKVTRPDHNLVRAQNQMRLVEQIEEAQLASLL